MKTIEIEYDDRVVRWFTWASIIWGIVGMSVGALVALQLAFWPANVHETLSFGRLRPLHTNAVIFAFVGNMAFSGIYYSTQRLLKARMASDRLSWIHFWGWQLIIVAAALTLPFGISQAKEYAELEWPIDIAITVVWVVFAVNFFWTLAKRREKQLYVAVWFYIATIITVAVLHIVNSLSIPVSATKSYSVFGGVQDALVQWWYGHNAVAFFLTTPILGIMYYFLPKAAERPVFSYRLSIVHFWGLVFIYIWAGPHHLLYTALPDWAQSLGMVFSLMLWAPSWGGMINGLLTLRGAWDKLRRDPVLKFFAAAVTFYGMATFEGPMLSIKSVSGLAHYTDWIIAHVHEGGLGWNGFMAAGMFYWLVPRLFGTKLYSERLANIHFWTGTIGILMYVISMWAGGITQGLMWRAESGEGGLQYPEFLETVLAIAPLYWIRLIGGTVYLLGFISLAWNLWKTAKSGAPSTTKVEIVVEDDAEQLTHEKYLEGEGQEPVRQPSTKEMIFSPVMILLAVLTGLSFLMLAGGTILRIFVVVLIASIAIMGGIIISLGNRERNGKTWHHFLEGRGLMFTVLTVIAVLIGGIAEIVPMVMANEEQLAATNQTPYTPLELEGRDVYLAEGCYTCHSQMIRPFVWETSRYGPVSRADESIFDHPFQWGSKRTGPDLAREGGMRSHLWHYQHMIDPRQISAGSIMPPYAHLDRQDVNFAGTADKLRAMRNIGVPYEPEEIQSAQRHAQEQAVQIASELSTELGTEVASGTKLIALIAYLQRLGKPETSFEPPTTAIASAEKEEN